MNTHEQWRGVCQVFMTNTRARIYHFTETNFILFPVTKFRGVAINNGLPQEWNTQSTLNIRIIKYYYSNIQRVWVMIKLNKNFYYGSETTTLYLQRDRYDYLYKYWYVWGHRNLLLNEFFVGKQDWLRKIWLYYSNIQAIFFGGYTLLTTLQPYMWIFLTTDFLLVF